MRDFPDLTPLGRTTITFAGGFVLMAILAIVSHLAGADLVPSIQMDARQAGLMTVYALGGMALSQLLFIASVGRIGIALVSLHINTAPFYVMVIVLFLGEAWSWKTAFGAAIVGFGVVISQQRTRALRRLPVHSKG